MGGKPRKGSFKLSAQPANIISGQFSRNNQTDSALVAVAPKKHVSPWLPNPHIVPGEKMKEFNMDKLDVQDFAFILPILSIHVKKRGSVLYREK